MSRPEVSVVMATHNAAGTIGECLESLRKQTFRGEAEIIVADCSTDGTDELIRKRFPGAKVLHVVRPRGVPELIKEAMRHTEGRIVAVTEPRCSFPADWLEKLRRAHESEYSVIGGAVENGRPDGLVSWACYFADYGGFMLPSDRKVTPILAGNHISYKREIIQERLDSMGEGFWKFFFNQELTRRGVLFLFDPELVAYYVPPETFWSFARRYYQHARFFAALRSREMSLGVRFLRAVSSPALPLVLSYRRLRGPVWERTPPPGRFVLVPFLSGFGASWGPGAGGGEVFVACRLPPP